MLMLLIVACDSKEEEPDPIEVLEELCIEQCDDSATGQDCDTKAVTRECESLCGFTILFLSEDCYDVYEAVLDCQVGLEYACNGGLEINGVDWPVPVDGAECADESVAYTDCLGTFSLPTTTSR